MVDGNHMLVGQNLKFNVEVVAIREATEEELAHTTFTARTIITTITTTTVAAAVMVHDHGHEHGGEGCCGGKGNGGCGCH